MVLSAAIEDILIYITTRGLQYTQLINRIVSLITEKGSFTIRLLLFCRGHQVVEMNAAGGFTYQKDVFQYIYVILHLIAKVRGILIVKSGDTYIRSSLDTFRNDLSVHWKIVEENLVWIESCQQVQVHDWIAREIITILRN